MTTPPDAFTAVLARIEAGGHQVGDFDVIGIIDSLMERGTALDDVTDFDFLKLLTQHAIEDQTDLPCPSWCQYEPGHVFESTHTLTGVQIRPHEAVLASRDDVYVGVVQKRTTGSPGTTPRPSWGRRSSTCRSRASTRPGRRCGGWPASC